MAMNKAERAKLEELKTALAFRWPTEAEPTPLTFDEIKDNAKQVSGSWMKVVTGWDYNSYNQRVFPAWSSTISHGEGDPSSDRGSQQPGRIFVTEEDAYVALRWDMCRDFAKRLRAVDVRLEEVR